MNLDAILPCTRCGWMPTDCPCRTWDPARPPAPSVPRPVRARAPRPGPGEVPPLPVLSVEQRRAAFARIVDVICTVEADNHRGAA